MGLLKKYKILPYFLVSFGVVGFFNYAINPYYQLGFNTSDSLGGYVYLIKKVGLPMTGDVVAFYPPKPNQTETKYPFLKIVKGVPGDRIKSTAREIYINNQFVAKAKEKAKNGNPLQVSVFNNGFIPPKHYFIWSPHKDSYDSRYKDIGLIEKSKIIGIATKLF